MTRSAVAGASLAVALAIAPALSQAPAQVPVFRGGVDRVAVDFLALRSDGQPVTDVTLADLSLKVDGRSSGLSRGSATSPVRSSEPSGRVSAKPGRAQTVQEPATLGHQILRGF